MVRIPITGIGVVAPGAIGVDAFRNLLASGATSIVDVTSFDTEGLHAHKAALVRDFNPREFIAPMKMRRMNTLSRLAVASAKMAIFAGALNEAPLVGLLICTRGGRLVVPPA